MSRFLTTDLLNHLNRHFVGMSNLTRYLDDDFNFKSSNYPPANIEQLDDNTYIVTLAVAGYSEKDISITFENRVLTISGNKTSETTSTYLYKGIANREFTRSFVLDSFIEIEKVDLSNGMLSIMLKREIPEALKPQNIPIGYSRNSVVHIDSANVSEISSETDENSESIEKQSKSKNK